MQLLKIVSVLLSASVERFFVSRLHHFFYIGFGKELKGVEVMEENQRFNVLKQKLRIMVDVIFFFSLQHCYVYVSRSVESYLSS